MSDVVSGKISCFQHLLDFHSSSSFQSLFSFVQKLNKSVEGRHFEEECCARLKFVDLLLNRLYRLVELYPASNHADKSRYGNKAFQDWHCASKNVIQDHLREHHSDLSIYFGDSFGNSLRIDYGSGHELNLLCFLYCVNEELCLSDADLTNSVLYILKKYLCLVHHLQKTYLLEPAGSQGVWGLDDYNFLPYLFGSSQLIGHSFLRPKSIHNQETVEYYKTKYFYFMAVAMCNESKVYSLKRHSPLLNDISAAKTWNVVNAGLMQMYLKEVLGKLAIMQHFHFGHYISFSSTGNNLANEKRINCDYLKETMHIPCCSSSVRMPSLLHSIDGEEGKDHPPSSHSRFTDCDSRQKNEHILFGLDLCYWKINPLCKGIKSIPSGFHFLQYCLPQHSSQNTPNFIEGFLIWFDDLSSGSNSKSPCIHCPSSECSNSSSVAPFAIKIATEAKEISLELISPEDNQDIMNETEECPYWLAYSDENADTFLTNFISPATIDLLLFCGRTGTRKRFRKVDSSLATYHTSSELHSEKFPVLNYTKFNVEKKKFLHSVEISQRKEMYFDEYYFVKKLDFTSLLGEFQLAFILFNFYYHFDSFIQWCLILNMLFNVKCHKHQGDDESILVNLRAFLTILHHQMRFIKEDFKEIVREDCKLKYSIGRFLFCEEKTINMSEELFTAFTESLHKSFGTPMVFQSSFGIDHWSEGDVVEESDEEPQIVQ